MPGARVLASPIGWETRLRYAAGTEFTTQESHSTNLLAGRHRVSGRTRPWLASTTAKQQHSRSTPASRKIPRPYVLRIPIVIVFDSHPSLIRPLQTTST